MHKIKLSVFSITAAYILLTVAPALAGGVLDPGFGNGGKVTLGVAPLTADWGRDVGIQSDGKIVISGGYSPPGQTWSEVAIWRLNPDGSLDTHYGTGGVLKPDFGQNSGAGSMAVLPGDKLLIGGARNGGFMLFRLNPDGTFDSDFGMGGKVLGTGFAFAAMQLQANGQIIVYGTEFGKLYIARYHANGSVDTQFGTQGRFMMSYPFGTQSWAIAAGADGGFLVQVTTQQFDHGWVELSSLFRLRPDLTRDLKFGRRRGVESYGRDSWMGSVLPLTDGRFIVSSVEFFGRGNSRSVIYSANGRLMGQFGIPSYAGFNFSPHALTPLPNGGFIGCSFNGANILLAKFDNWGAVVTTDRLDFLFGDNNCNRLTVQPDHKVLVMGSADTDPSVNRLHDIAIARYTDFTP